MTTKPKLKKIPLPKGIEKLPEGAVFLGQINDQEKMFTGWYMPKGTTAWKQSARIGGGVPGVYYAAPADSAIAREILGEPAKPVTKRKAAKKTITLRKLPKNVKPGTKVVCVDDTDLISVKNGDVFEVANDRVEFMALSGKTGWWSKHRFRLAPDKKPHVQRSKRIGMMRQLADLNPVLSEFGKNALKFGEAFARSAERDGITLHDWLPALPPVPAGYDRWEPKGMEWSQRQVVYACCSELEPWVTGDQIATAHGCFGVFYIEAVRDERPEAATDNASAHIELHQKEISRIGSPTPYAADYWPQKAEEIRRNSAVGLLTEAAETIGARAAERDVESERSMAKCVSAFNVMFGKDITEEQGWLFMVLLKMSRSTVGHRRDDFLDGAAYMSLAGECALNQEKP